MKRLKAAFLVVAAAALATGISGCGTSAKSITSFASNWYFDAAYKRIQPEFCDGHDNFVPERLTYKVTQTEPSLNGDYSVEYGEGEYVTVFYAKTLNEEGINGITDESWRKDYLDLRGKDGTLTLYYYATSLNIPCTYKCGTQTAAFDNVKVTESYFLSVEDDLQPVYSVQTVSGASPANLRAGTVDQTYVKVDAVYETFYKADRTELLTKVTDNIKGSSYDYSAEKISDGDYPVYDAAYLEVVARGMKNMTTTLNQPISLYTPCVDIRNYSLTSQGSPLCEDEAKSAAQLAGLQSLLQEKGLFVPGTVKAEDGTESPKTLKTADIEVNYSNGRLSGVTQKYYFAAADGDNRGRALLLKISTPLTYNLGTLEYVLSSIDSMPNI